MRIESVDVWPIELALEEPFEISLGVKHAATNVLVRLETDGGTVGYGEGAPIEPITGETQASTVETARAGAKLLEGRAGNEWRSLVEALHAALPGATSALFALETALLDAYARDRSLPLSALFGGPPAPVRTDITVPIVGAEEAHAEAARAIERGFDCLKVKVGGDVREDLERVTAVREAAPDAELTVDANQGWTPKEAIRFVRETERTELGLAMLEQPVHRDDLDGLERVTRSVDVPVAADETVFTPADAHRVASRGAADVINVKGGKSGLCRGAAIAAVARAGNLDVMVGCMLESALGLSACAHLVAGLGGVRYVDLDGNQSFAEDVVPLEPSTTLDIAGAGHGIVPETDVVPDGARR